MGLTDLRKVTKKSSVRLNTGAGHGSTNTKVRIISNVVENVGSAITYASTAAAGDSFTINERGTYAMTYVDTATGSTSNFGISLNSSELTTNVGGLSTPADRLTVVGAATATYTECSAIAYLVPGDVIRPHTHGNPNSTDTKVSFSIVKMSD